jgi:hypothetical protein
MNCRTQVIVATGVGYFLGRQHKLRWGLALAAAAAAGRISGSGDILQRGVKALTSSPGPGGIAGLGAPLVSAGKEAARAAVAGQIESATGKLRERAEGLRHPGAGRRAPDEQPDEETGRRSPATRRDEGRPDDGRPQERPRRRSRAAREEREDRYEEEPSAQRRRPAAERDDVETDVLERADLDRDVAARDEADDEEYDEPEEEPPALSGVGRSRSDAGSRSPVHRRGR